MKLLVTDYDGTLRYGQDVMEEDVNAIRRWKDAGNLYAIATGRSKFSILDQAKLFDIPADYYITNNGGVILDANGRNLVSNYLDTLTAVDIIYAIKELNDDVASYVVNDGENRHRIIVNPNVQEVRYPSFEPDLPEEEVLAMGRFGQLVISMANPDAALTMAREINENFHMSVTAYANGCAVDVVPKDTSKATGLEFVCEYADVDPDDVFTIGDGYNDLPLITFNDQGYAMVMAPEDVKLQAAGEYFSVCELIDSLLNS